MRVRERERCLSGLYASFRLSLIQKSRIEFSRFLTPVCASVPGCVCVCACVRKSGGRDDDELVLSTGIESQKSKVLMLVYLYMCGIMCI